jgi:hypothetical protein
VLNAKVADEQSINVQLMLRHVLDQGHQINQLLLSREKPDGGSDDRDLKRCRTGL